MVHGMSESLKTLLLAGIGAVATSVEKSQEIVDKLTKKGELTVEQGKVLNEELKHLGEKKAEASSDSSEVSELDVSKSLGTILAHFDELSASDRKLLAKKLAASGDDTTADTTSSATDHTTDRSTEHSTDHSTDSSDGE